MECSAVLFNLLHRLSISGMEMDPGVVCRGHEGLQKERQGNRLCLKARGGGLALGKAEPSCSGMCLGTGWEPVGEDQASPAWVTPWQASPAHHWCPLGASGGRSRAGTRNRRLLESIESKF